MERLFSPWRSRYIATFKEEKPKTNESLFTRIAREKNDSKNLVLMRKKYCYVMMNLYPYNSGHVMIVPYKQASELRALSKAEIAEIMIAITETMDALTKVLKPHGFNFGANFGRVAGAGIDEHIHFHIVPRWNGDTNFMPTLNDVKVVSEDMNETYLKIKKVLNAKSKKRTAKRA